MAPVVAVIAPGAMGSAVAARLVQHGVEVRTSLAGRSPASAERARQAGMRAVDDDAAIAACDIILSIIPPGEAVTLARRFAPALAAAARKPVYVDCNAVNPATMTRIYLSGPEAHRAAALAKYGLDMPVLDGPVGKASALKMSYAGVTKGFTALGAAMMLAAANGGTTEELKRELATSQPQLLAWLTRGVPGMYSKAYRWVAEMEEIAGFVGEPGAALYEAAARFYDSIAEDYAGPRAKTARLSEFCSGG